MKASNAINWLTIKIFSVQLQKLKSSAHQLIDQVISNNLITVTWFWKYPKSFSFFLIILNMSGVTTEILDYTNIM